MRRGPLTNCAGPALRLWLQAGGRSWVAMRRSRGLHGAVPHFAFIRDTTDRLTVIEYSPLHRKERFLSRGAPFLLFRGHFLVREYLLVGDGTGYSIREALRNARPNKRCVTCVRRTPTPQESS